MDVAVLLARGSDNSNKMFHKTLLSSLFEIGYDAHVLNSKHMLKHFKA